MPIIGNTTITLGEVSASKAVDQFLKSDVGAVVTDGWHLSYFSQNREDIVTPLHRIFIHYDLHHEQFFEKINETGLGRAKRLAEEYISQYLELSAASIILRATTTRIRDTIGISRSYIVIEVNYLRNQVKVGFTTQVAQNIVDNFSPVEEAETETTT